MEKYNNRVHRAKRMTPFEMSINNNKPIPNYDNTARLASHINHTEGASRKNKLPKFQLGNFVTVPDKRNINSKGFTTIWNRELFEIHKIKKTNPAT